MTQAAVDITIIDSPEGVGPVVKDDRLRAEIDGLSPLDLLIA